MSEDCMLGLLICILHSQLGTHQLFQTLIAYIPPEHHGSPICHHTLFPTVLQNKSPLAPCFDTFGSYVPAVLHQMLNILNY